MEGGIGPVAGSSHHSLYFRMPGVKIASPMTPKEYIAVYNNFMKDNDVYYVSEHRKSYDNSVELKDSLSYDKYDLIIFAEIKSCAPLHMQAMIFFILLNSEMNLIIFFSCLTFSMALTPPGNTKIS